jgi:DNA-binding response OmpR family regulator
MEKEKKTVLIVEDEPSIRQAIVDKFTREGFQVLEGKNGVEGVKLAGENSPDVMLLDIVMPEMDGLEALKQIRSQDWGKKIPIFMLTNLSDMEKISEAVQIGITGYLVKSDWKLEDVIAKVRETLKPKE